MMRWQKVKIGVACVLLNVAGMAQPQAPPPSAASASPAAHNEKAIHPVEPQHAPCSEWISRFVAPVYPPLARMARVEGSVFVKVELDGSGNVMTADVIEGHPMLRQAAVDAVKKWRFSSFGNPVETVQVKFTISADPKEDPPGVIITPPDEIEIIAEAPVVETTTSSSSKVKRGKTPKKP